MEDAATYNKMNPSASGSSTQALVQLGENERNSNAQWPLKRIKVMTLPVYIETIVPIVCLVTWY